MTQPPGFEAVLVTLSKMFDGQDGPDPELDPDPGADSAPESDGDLLARIGTDASLWALEFVLHALVYAEGGGDPLDPTPGDFLHGWFANAIEAGRTAGHWAGVRAAENGQQSVERFLESFSPSDDGDG